MNKQITNLLFVCWGNICRSPFAGALFTKLTTQSNRKGFTGDSAGLFALHGNSATHMAQKVAAEYGVDLTSSDFTRDLLVAIAVFFGGVRLIDNTVLGAEKGDT